MNFCKKAPVPMPIQDNMTKQDQEIKKLLTGKFQHVQPGDNFTEDIMSRITELETVTNTESFEYKPVISKWGWLAISVFLSTVFYIGLTGEGQETLMVQHYLLDWQFDFSIFYSRLTLFAFVSMLALLMIDSLMKVRRA